jgi:hypothetical protein
MHNQGSKFWLGNAVMAVALLILLFMGTLWQYLGFWAMGLWAAVAGLGGYLLMADKGKSPNEPD